MDQAEGNAWAYTLLAAVSVFWGASFVAARVGLREMTPVNLVTLRFVIAALIFGPIAWAYQRRGSRIGGTGSPCCSLPGWG